MTNPAIKREIEGYASLTSVNRGSKINLFVNTKSLYRWNSRGKKAYKVSFNRPYAMSPHRHRASGIGHRG